MRMTLSAMLVLAALAATPARAEETPKELQINPPTAAVNYFRGNAPAYPNAARRFELQGSVGTEITISPEGTASCRVFASAGDPLLDTAVVEWCASAPRFAPAQQNGIAVPHTFKLRYSFKLQPGQNVTRCGDLEPYEEPLPGPRGKLIEQLVAIDDLEFGELYAGERAGYRADMAKTAERFERVAGTNRNLAGDAKPTEVSAWIRERTESSLDRYIAAIDATLAADSPLMRLLVKERRCAFAALNETEARAAVEFQRTPMGRKILHASYLAGGLSEKAVRKAILTTRETFARALQTEFNAAFPAATTPPPTSAPPQNPK